MGVSVVFDGQAEALLVEATLDQSIGAPPVEDCDCGSVGRIGCIGVVVVPNDDMPVDDDVEGCKAANELSD